MGGLTMPRGATRASLGYMSDLSGRSLVLAERRTLRPVILTPPEADEVAIAAGAARALPDFADAPDTNHAALAAGIRKLDGAVSPFDDPIFLATSADSGSTVQAVEGMTAWICHPAGATFRVEATIGEDVTIYTVLQDGGPLRKGLLAARRELLRVPHPAAQARFATIVPPAGIERHMGDGCAVESYSLPKAAPRRRTPARRVTPVAAQPTLPAIAA